MKKELYERVSILEENGVIGKRAADYTRWVVEQILVQVPGVSQEKAEMFITHLAMATKRAEEGSEENPINQAILAAVKTEAIFPEALAMRDRLLSKTEIVFPETEQDFLSVHLCNLLT